MPSGVWTLQPAPAINNATITVSDHNQNSHQSNNRMGNNKSAVIIQTGNTIGKMGSSCCSENIGSSGSSSTASNNGPNRRRNKSSENTYRSFAYGEDSELYEALAGGDSSTTSGLKSHLGHQKSPSSVHADEENELGMQNESSSSWTAAAQSTFYPHRTFKVILAGDAAVGKTTFIERICHGHFTPNLSSTIGNKNLNVFNISSLVVLRSLNALR